MASIATSPAPAADIPDWLKNTTDRLNNTSDPLATVAPVNNIIPEASPVVTTVPEAPAFEPIVSVPLTSAPEAVLPDWLVGSNATPEASTDAPSETDTEIYTETFAPTVPEEENWMSPVETPMTSTVSEEDGHLERNFIPNIEIEASMFG